MPVDPRIHFEILTRDEASAIFRRMAAWAEEVGELYRYQAEIMERAAAAWTRWMSTAIITT